MSPSWWLGAAACGGFWTKLAPPAEVLELVEKKKLTEQFKTADGLIDRAVSVCCVGGVFTDRERRRRRSGQREGRQTVRALESHRGS